MCLHSDCESIAPQHACISAEGGRLDTSHAFVYASSFWLGCDSCFMTPAARRRPGTTGMTINDFQWVAEDGTTSDIVLQAGWSWLENRYPSCSSGFCTNYDKYYCPGRCEELGVQSGYDCVSITPTLKILMPLQCLQEPWGFCMFEDTCA